MTVKPTIFIHIPKNGGMTIRKSPILKNRIIVCGPETHKSKEYTQTLLDVMNSNGDHHGFEHARWRDLDPNLTKMFGAFAIVRNPWDRVVSRYFFAKKVIEVEKTQPSSYANVTSFEAFLDERFKWGNQPFMWHRAVRGWFPAFDHVSDVFGNVKCDILRFENYNDDVCAYFDIPKMSRARNVTALNKDTYRELYTPKTIQIIADWYKKDIDHWGFDFDSGPTKNYWRNNNGSE